MLLNLSNHPYATWQDVQKAEAEKRFGAVMDFPFPAVDPAWSSEAVSDLAKSVVEAIKPMSPSAIHVMGEMTLTFTLVALFQAAGFACVASTSERLVHETADGKKVVTFTFTQFRAYPRLSYGD
ncbi:MAG: CRISPR-associated protein [Rhodothermia bacterium]|nr:CRISPR-associated protein [Rhodothermia bacterium]